jgi:exo beta-1,2-glucooligosaccharide sophorohydrolase (non-reducing end)
MIKFGLSSFLFMSVLSSMAAPSDALLAPPAKFKVLSRQLRLDLTWSDADASMNYEVQRSRNPKGPFETLPVEVQGVSIYSDFIGNSGDDYYYRVRAIHFEDTNQPAVFSTWSEVRHGSPRPLDVEQLLTDVEEGGFRYFYDYGHPGSGLARVGTRKNLDVCSSGSTGWGMYNLVVGIERGFITRREGAERALKILDFLSNKADRFHGAFPHWLNGSTGKTISFSKYDNGADIVETAFLMEGIILLREYFSGHNGNEVEIRKLADGLWRAVEWDWFAQEKDGSAFLFWHWSPNYGWFKNHPISGFNECQIVYLLALASPTHPIQPKFYWGGWESAHYATPRTEFGIPLELGRDIGPPLFWTHYSYLGLDPRQISYHGQTYFDQFRDLCRVQILYAQSKKDDFRGYGALWGITAGYGPSGYHAFEPGPRDNGTINPTAALSSMPYVPNESRAFLLEMYEKYGSQLWGPFGFYDGINLSKNWVARDYLGNDVGPIAPMIENYRSGLCWKTFMQAPEIGPILKLLAEPPDKTNNVIQH